MNEQIKNILLKGKNKDRYEIIKRKANEDHLKEGIGSYIFSKPVKKVDPNKFVNKSKYSKIRYESRSYYISQRVLYPDKDIQKQRISRKKVYSMEKNSKDIKDVFKSFITKTPSNYPVKSRNYCNRSYDNSKKEHDIFLLKNINEGKTERIFGVERKKIVKNHNYESDLPRLKFSKKLFYDKGKINDYFL